MIYWRWRDTWCNLYIIRLTTNNYKPVIYGKMGEPNKRYTWNQVKTWEDWTPITEEEVKKYKLEQL